MIDIVFIALLLAYLAIGIKVDQWITISLLGFKSETPLIFLKSPHILVRVRIGVFIAAAATLWGITFPWYLGGGALAVAWFTTAPIGQRLAFNDFRRICQELAETAETVDEKSYALVSSRKTNPELREFALKMSMFRI